MVNGGVTIVIERWMEDSMDTSGTGQIRVSFTAATFQHTT